jgi:hypothetical protein
MLNYLFVCRSDLFITQHLLDSLAFLSLITEKGALEIILRVCMYVCVHACVHMLISSAEPVERLSRNLVRTLRHWRPSESSTFYFTTVNNNNMADARNCEAVVKLVPLNLEPEVMYDNRSRKNAVFAN